MTNEQARLLAYGKAFDALINVIAEGGIPSQAVEDAVSKIGGPGLPTGETTVPKKERKLETVVLADKTQITAEIKSEPTKGGRTRNYITRGRKKILMTKTNGHWRERIKAQRDFSKYKPVGDDKALLVRLGELNSKGRKPKFMELADELKKTRGQLLGRYRNVYGAGYVQRSGNGYVLTQKGKDFVGSVTKSGAPKRRARSRKKS